MPRSARSGQTGHRAAPHERMAIYRQRMRDAGLRPVQIWVPDTRAAGFIAACKRQAQVVAAHDPAGDEALAWIEQVYEWPED